MFRLRFQHDCLLYSFLLWLVLFLPGLALAGPTIYVPAPNGVNDTAAIQASLDDCMTNYPTGCTVQLSSGTYKTAQLFGEDFYGRIQGMGRDATVLEVLAPLEVTVTNNDVFAIPPGRSNKYPMLMIFTAGDIVVSDMTFKVTDVNPATPWCYASLGCGQTWLKGLVGAIGVSANLTVERVAFEGAPGTIDGRNYDNGTFFFGVSSNEPLQGMFQVLSSRFQFGANGFEVYNVRGARILIGGSPGNGNVIEQGIAGGVIVDLDNSTFEYSHNTVAINSSYAGLMILQASFVLPEIASQFRIEHNTFSATGPYVDGIYALDYGPVWGAGKKVNLMVNDNTIQIGSPTVDPALSGIHFLLTESAVITNNRISGNNALFGIAAEADTGCLLQGNNVQQLHAELLPVALLGINSNLPWDTSNCTVVGGNNKVNVYDEGTDNTLVGVNNTQGNPPGPALKKAMQQKRDLMKARLR